jgi:hypothetical protein
VTERIVIELHVTHHFPDPLNVLTAPARRPAVRAVLHIEGVPPVAPTTINIDTVNEQAKIAYVDDKGDLDAQAPDGAVATFTSDNDAVLTIDPSSGQITVVGEGVANVGATIVGSDGNPLTETDGTPWPAVDPAPVTVTAGAAVGARLSVGP